MIPPDASLLDAVDFQYGPIRARQRLLGPIKRLASGGIIGTLLMAPLKSLGPIRARQRLVLQSWRPSTNRRFTFNYQIQHEKTQGVHVSLAKICAIIFNKWKKKQLKVNQIFKIRNIQLLLQGGASWNDIPKILYTTNIFALNKYIFSFLYITPKSNKMRNTFAYAAIVAW